MNTTATPAVRLALCVQAHNLNSMTSAVTEGRHVWRVPNNFYALSTRLIDRAICETDEATLQLLPYNVLQRENGDIFMYARGKGGAEARLVGNLSIGVGGHVDEEPAADESLYDLMQREAKREIKEEVGIVIATTIGFHWLLRDMTNPVGRVHLGLVSLIQVDENQVASQEPGVIESGCWQSLASLKEPETYNRLESWSQALVDEFTK
jgi:predicted NUDIX family phosphoesterase